MLDLPVTFAGLCVGLIVGLTGMGGGALMTPVLILLFGMQPLAAVSSDLVASMVMKPLGAAVHLQRRTVHRRLVLWLTLGSVPSAFVGVLVLHHQALGAALQDWVKHALGAALLLVAATLLVRPLLARWRSSPPDAQLVVKPVPTLLIGMLGGLVVGLTSVGSGSLIMMLLLLTYPGIRLADLVGTDLVQAVPLVASAALAHLFFGDFQLAVTTSIVVGSLPGIYIGARLSSRASDRVIRPLLLLVLISSAAKLLGASNLVLGLLTGLLALGFGLRLTLGPERANARAATS